MADEHPRGLVSITWLRPEFEDQWEKLINLADVAVRAEVTKAAVSNWRNRYPDFPAPVVEQRDSYGKAIRVWISTEEFETWRTTRTRPTGKKRQPNPSSAIRKLTRQLTAINEKLDAARAVVDDLESRRREILDALNNALTAALADATAARKALRRTDTDDEPD